MRIDADMAEIERAARWFFENYGDEDEQLAQDFFEGETNIHRVAARIWEQVARDTEILAGIKERKAAIAERQDRLERRVEVGKAAIGDVLRRAHLKKLELPEVTLSVRDGKPKLEIVDKEAVPPSFQRATYAPDKTMINEAYTDSDALPNWLTRLPAKDIVTGRTR